MATAVIQARMSSSRLPGKVMRRLGDRSVLGWVIRAARCSQGIERVVVATSTEPEDNRLEHEAKAHGSDVARGPLDDVLKRFVMATSIEDDAIVRLTADCPLLDPTVISMAVASFSASDVHYLSTIHPRSLPRGLDVEVFSREALLEANRSAIGYQRVHVTPWLYEQRAFGRAGLVFWPDASDLRVTIDTEEDLTVVSTIVDAHGGDSIVPWRNQVSFLRAHPEVAAINSDVRQKELEDG